MSLYQQEGTLLPCPVCGQMLATIDKAMFDDRYGHPGIFSLARCNGCGHVMTAPRIAESELPALYGTYYPRKGQSPAAIRRQADSAMGMFSRLRRWWLGEDNQGQYVARTGQKVLDVGCGNGTSLLEIQALGAQAYGIEADPNVRTLALALDLHIHQGSLHDNPFPGVSFDLVLLNQVIEHIPEPDKALTKVAQRLAPGGRVVLVFPNRASLWCRMSGQKWINWHIPYHLHHFDLEGITRMAASAGLTVVKHRTVTPNLWTLLQLRASRAPTTRGVPNPLWHQNLQSAEELADRKSAATTLSMRRILLWSALSATALLNRAVDLAGHGDSLMVELQLLAEQ